MSRAGIPIYQVDAFTSAPFAGNPAGVCLLEREAPERWMQSVAAEMNVSETAFVVPGAAPFPIRYFTPNVEVPLCGHATLSTAHILWEEGRVPGDRPISFQSAAGRLGAVKEGSLIRLDLPASPPGENDVKGDLAAALAEAVGRPPRAAYYAGRPRVVLFRYESEEEVAALAPDFHRLRAGRFDPVIATAPAGGAPYDFVSRFFAPELGIDEDPVTGWAHTVLAPYWSALLGRETMTGHQISPRGGVVQVRARGDRVDVGGEAVTVIRGELISEPD